jgi:1-phosphofructokinase family hexose kinase
MILTVTLNAAVDKTHVIPGFGTGRVNRPAEVLALAGGKGINVARVLRELGEPAFATGIVAGHSGAFIETCLDAEGIVHAFHRLPRGESRTCLAVVHPETGTTTEINETGARVEPEEFERFVARFEALLPQASWVALSGSMPPGLTGEAYLRLMAIARRAGKRVSLDTSGCALAEALASEPDVVKPNQDEAEALLGHPVTLERLPEAVQGLLARGARMVALSLGALGAAVATRDEAWYYQAPAVSVVNPIGSGDSFLAGLLVALSRGQSLAEAGRLAVACGTANAAVAGAAACKLALIHTLLPQIQATPLDEARSACGTTP